MKTRILALTFFLAVFLFSYGHALAQHTIPKLVIQPKQIFQVGENNILRVDTLVMLDKSTILFDPAKYGELEASVAIIGTDCTISAKGADGVRSKNSGPASDGGKGGDLDLTLHFVELGQLAIDVSGGNGAKGTNGKNGKPGKQDTIEKSTSLNAKGKPMTVITSVPGIAGTNGTDATMGGNGGNGGNLTLKYSTAGFIPIFNQKNRQQNCITILHLAGQQGENGKPGKGGFMSTDGTLLPSAYKASSDGTIQLLKLDNIE